MNPRQPTSIRPELSSDPRVGQVVQAIRQMKHQLANRPIGFDDSNRKSDVLAYLFSADDRHLHPSETMLAERPKQSVCIGTYPAPSNVDPASVITYLLQCYPLKIRFLRNYLGYSKRPSIATQPIRRQITANRFDQPSSRRVQGNNLILLEIPIKNQ